MYLPVAAALSFYFALHAYCSLVFQEILLVKLSPVSTVIQPDCIQRDTVSKHISNSRLITPVEYRLEIYFKHRSLVNETLLKPVPVMTIFIDGGNKWNSSNIGSLIQNFLVYYQYRSSAKRVARTVVVLDWVSSRATNKREQTRSRNETYNRLS